MRPANAELYAVGPDEALITFTTASDESVVTRVGSHEVTTVGPQHVVRVTDLEPDTDYEVEVEGASPNGYLPASLRTLPCPPGKHLATIATANDVHFGEKECGHLGPPHEDIGPFFSSAPGEPPYPETMNRSVVDAMRELDPNAVVIKGDLTSIGSEDEYAAFLALYGSLGERMHHVRGNHDAMIDPSLALEDAPYVVEVEGATLVVVDTVIPGTDGGQLRADQVQFIDDVASSTSNAVLVFGHHYLWDLDSDTRNPLTFGITPDDSEALAEVVARRENVQGYFAGHTHRNRIRRYERVRNVPFVEVACTKDYPGAWAEYRIYEGGYTQVARRATAPDAFDWAERTRGMFAGVYTDYALGELDHRCFTEIY